MLTTHYLVDRLEEPNRPLPGDILAGLTEDAPKIVRVDNDDVRGGLCEIVCEAPNGAEITIRINYEKNPMRLVTAFYRGGAP